MIDLRDLAFLQALAQHRHFARAAKAVGVSQPAFSMRIQKLEDRLGVALVRRDNRFQGLTAQGELLLQGGIPLLDGAKALEQEIVSAKGRAAGVLRLGVIPTATSFAGSAAATLAKAHPDILVRIETASSLVIQQRLIEGSLDVGVSYTDGVDQDVVRAQPLYDEGYALLCPQTMVPYGARQITWTKAAALPLALLDTTMQNRAILDRVFAELGVVPKIVAETNALTAAMVMARDGFCATVIPEVMADGLAENLGETIVIDLVSPEVRKSISLLSPARGVALPVVRALLDVLGLTS